MNRANAGRRMALLAALALLGALTAAGCKTDTKMPEEDKANFNGGPMPADFKPGVPAGPPPAAAPK
ncbi:MAG TPA: hypothetical protein VM490_17535 [Armatimonadaceae bacterium]|nr:hypothetical protein [Armatimonadaceae bacterium]